MSRALLGEDVVVSFTGRRDYLGRVEIVNDLLKKIDENLEAMQILYEQKVNATIHSKTKS